MPALLSADLPATRTYARRGFYYLPTAGGVVPNPHDPDHTAPGVGQLVIACARVTKKAVTATVDAYAVQPADTGTPTQVAYLLAKLAPADAPADVYQVEGGAYGRKCSCPAGHAGKPCKHLAAVAAVVAAGGLPGPKKC